MKGQDNTSVNVSVLERKYPLTCPPEEVENLKSAAAYLDQQMRDLRKRNKISNGEKLAVVTALNITSELLKIRNSSPAPAEISQQLTAMENRILDALATTGSDISPKANSADN